jgi:hypothetical protein
MTCAVENLSFDIFAVAARCTGTTPQAAHELAILGGWVVLPFLVLVAIAAAWALKG